jgi:hypothetical protein
MEFIEIKDKITEFSIENLKHELVLIPKSRQDIQGYQIYRCTLENNQKNSQKRKTGIKTLVLCKGKKDYIFIAKNRQFDFKDEALKFDDTGKPLGFKNMLNSTFLLNKRIKLSDMGELLTILRWEDE